MRQFVSGICLFAAAAIVVVTSTSCGGGGGSGGGNGGGSGTLSLFPVTLTVGPNGQIPLLATVGGVPVDVSWSATGGSITPTSIGNAILTAPPSGTVTVTVQRIGAPGSDSSSFTINPAFATVSGRVIDEDSLAGIGGVTIQFKSGATTVATGTTIPNGFFAAGVPTTATRFQVASTGLPSGYYKQFTYDAKRYTMLTASCTAPLPALTVGIHSSLIDSIRLPNTFGPPPPPPNGCP